MSRSGTISSSMESACPQHLSRTSPIQSCVLAALAGCYLGLAGSCLSAGLWASACRCAHGIAMTNVQHLPVASCCLSTQPSSQCSSSHHLMPAGMLMRQLTVPLVHLGHPPDAWQSPGWHVLSHCLNLLVHQVGSIPSSALAAP